MNKPWRCQQGVVGDTRGVSRTKILERPTSSGLINETRINSHFIFTARGTTLYLLSFAAFLDRGSNQARASSDAPIDKSDHLDNTLKPEGCLKRSMTLEEARHCTRKFDQWFQWNATVLTKKDCETQRVLLENFLDEKMLSRVKSDVTVTANTPIRGPHGLLAKLESYYTDDLQSSTATTLSPANRRGGRSSWLGWNENCKRDR